MSEMMVGRKISLVVEKSEAKPKDIILSAHDLNIKSHKSSKNIIKNVSFEVRAGEIVCIAGIDGNGQSELIYALTGLMELNSGSVKLKGHDITNLSIRKKTLNGIGHIPEDRHKYGLVLDYILGENLILQTYFTDKFQNNGFLKFK